jgi:hypothetical protein
VCLHRKGERFGVIHKSGLKLSRNEFTHKV